MVKMRYNCKPPILPVSRWVGTALHQLPKAALVDLYLCALERFLGTMDDRGTGDAWSPITEAEVAHDALNTLLLRGDVVPLWMRNANPSLYRKLAPPEQRSANGRTLKQIKSNARRLGYNASDELRLLAKLCLSTKGWHEGVQEFEDRYLAEGFGRRSKRLKNGPKQ